MTSTSTSRPAGRLRAAARAAAAADRRDRRRSRSRSAPPSLAKRSIKKESKLYALDLAVRMIDLTTLEGADTPGKVAALCAKAMRPDPADPTVPRVAAVCVYPNLVPAAVERLARQRRQGRGGRDRASRPASRRSRSSSRDVERGRRARAPTRSTW